MVGELFAEIVHEVTAAPTTMIIELVQFVILVLIVKVAVFGFGKRRGFLANILSERLARLNERVERASHADADLGAAQVRAEERITTARNEAAALLRRARDEARSAQENTDARIAEDHDKMLRRAEETLATELDEMHAGVRETLVELVAGATRSVLSETCGPSEQRVLIQRAILEGIERIEGERTVATGSPEVER